MSTDPKKPNHFYHDGAGDPATCTEDHNHPEPESDEGPVVEATVEVIPAKQTARERGGPQGCKEEGREEVSTIRIDDADLAEVEEMLQEAGILYEVEK